jgi:hypothetical protein
MILTVEVVGFFAVLAIIWLDEFADIPALYFGAPKTPRRPEEYWFESLAVFFLGMVVVSTTFWIFRRLRYLEQFVRVCAWCRKVLVNEQWVSFEEYMRVQHDVDSSHGICPVCQKLLSRARDPDVADLQKNRR